MMKVVQINCSDQGSIGKIINSIGTALTDRFDKNIVYYGLGMPSLENNHIKITMKYEPGLYRRISYITGYCYGFAPVSTYRLWKLIQKEQPDIVHLHCPNGFMVNVYTLVKKLKHYQYPIVITNHCEMFYTGSCAHSFECEGWKNGCGHCKYLHENVGPFIIDRTDNAWKKMRNAFNGIKKICVTSVSQWIYERASVSPILGKYNNVIIENGINTEIFYNHCPNKNEIKEHYKIDTDKKMVLFVTAHFKKSEQDNKGGYYFIQIANLLKKHPITFVLVGSTGAEEKLPPNIVNIGRVENDNKLADLYAIADLTIILSRKETFSMPCAESLCCGTPVVGFESGGPESISLAQYSEFCQYGNVEQLKNLILKWVKVKEDEFVSYEIQKTASLRYDVSHMNQEYLAIYDALISTNKTLRKIEKS